MGSQAVAVGPVPTFEQVWRWVGGILYEHMRAGGKPLGDKSFEVICSSLFLEKPLEESYPPFPSVTSLCLGSFILWV